MPSIPLQISDYIYANWNVPSINKDTDVYWNSWYTGKDDITIHFKELITTPKPVTLPWYRFDYRTYVDINVFVTDNNGTLAPRRDDIRNYIDNLIGGDPSGFGAFAGTINGVLYDMVKIDSITPSEDRDEDYQNDIFRLMIRLELLGNKQF